MTERENVADEQKGTENRALGDPLSDRRECGFMTRERDELLSVGEVGSKPVWFWGFSGGFLMCLYILNY